MANEGGCYCGAIRFEVEGDPMFKGQCHCRECQYMTGGNPNHVMAFPEAGFRYTKGMPATFTRTDLEAPVTREFCGTCGTPLGSRTPQMPGAMLLKVGVLDDPSLYPGPEMAIFLCDKQDFHTVPEGVPAFEKGPGSPAAS